MTGPPPSRLRVLHVVLDLDAGGLQRLVVDLIRGSDRTQFEHQVLVIREPGLNAADLDGIATIHVAAPMPRWSLLYPGELIRRMRAIAPDVLHSHSGVWYKASFAARRVGVPRLVHTDHGRPWPDPWNYHVADYLASRRTDVVVPVSHALARFLVTRLHIRAELLRVIENGIDTTRFQPRADTGALRRELGLGPDVPILGSIGRFDHIKGYDIMLRAFARLVADWRDGGGASPHAGAGGGWTGAGAVAAAGGPAGVGAAGRAGRMEGGRGVAAGHLHGVHPGVAQRRDLDFPSRGDERGRLSRGYGGRRHPGGPRPGPAASPRSCGGSRCPSRGVAGGAAALGGADP